MEEVNQEDIFSVVNKNISEISFELANKMKSSPEEFRLSEGGDVMHTSGVFYDHNNFVVGYTTRTSSGEEERLLAMDDENIEHVHMAYIDWMEWNSKNNVKKFVKRLNLKK